MKKNLQLKSEEYVLLFIFLLICGAVSYLGLQKIKEYDIHKTKTTLITVNKSSTETLHQWLRGRKKNIIKIAKNNYVLESAKKLLSLPQDSTALVSSETTEDLRNFFTPILDMHEDLGVFIISPDYTSTFSMRNENTDTYNLIAEQNKNVLDQVFTKEKTLLIPPIKSDVPLLTKYGNSELKKMFIATPIIDRGHIIAVLTFRIDIKKDFSRILEIGAIGETGETYTYNESGKILSKTRFTEGLQERLDLSIPNSNENNQDLFVGDTMVNIDYNVTETNKFGKKIFIK